jgi:hypothetical protein
MLARHDQHEPVDADLGALTATNGQTLRGVRYVMHSGLETLASAIDAADEIDWAIELKFDTGSIVLRWDMYGEAEWLSVTRGVLPELQSDTVELLDAAARPGWSSRAGRKVCRVGIAMDSPIGDGKDYLWAVRLEFIDASPVVIALGEIHDGMPSYHPTALLAIFDAELAQFYRPNNAPESAWGVTLYPWRS